MSDVITFTPGGYRYLKGVFQYSAGVAAEPGFRLERVRFAEPVPLAAGFARVKAIIEASGRPLTSFAACELRSPAPFTEAGFEAFNKIYAGTLKDWGIFGENNPVARSNVCPEVNPPAEPSFYAFAYTVADKAAAPSFVVAGSGEAPEGKGGYAEHCIARGDVSPAGLRKKAQWVLGEMERRMSALGFGWKDTTGVQAYTVHDIHPFLGEELAKRGAMRAGLTWHFNRPPVRELEYEMDCRGVAIERVV